MAGCRDTSGARTEVKQGSLRRPGLRGLIAVRFPAASDLAGVYKDVGTVLMNFGTSIVLSFKLSTSESKGPAISAIRTSSGCYPFERNVVLPISST